MSEARFDRNDDEFLILPANSAAAYEVWQLPSGEAAFFDTNAAVTAGQWTAVPRTRGKATIKKANGVTLLAGGEAWWDASANEATYRKVNDRDFYLGVVAQDAASGAPTVTVDLNKQPRVDIDLTRDFFLTSVTGTQGLNTMGMFHRGGGCKFILSTANEVQKVDLLSVDGFSKDANPIVEAVFRVVNGGPAGAPDFNIGLANGTHATDADAITEHAFVHVDGNSTTIKAQSKDGTTTVAAADTLQTYTAGSTVATRVHVWIDARDLTSVKFYVNAAQVLPGTTFRLDNVASTLFLLAHLEKTIAADVFEADVERLRVRFSEQ